MAEHQDSVERRSPALTARLVFGGVLLAAVVAVCVDNRRKTRIGYVFGDVEAPLILVLVSAAVLGAIIGWLFLHRPRRDRSDRD
jgi:uncharacterized integral membrane protein